VSTPTTGSVIDTVSDPRHPFGLPLGTVRGFMSLLICVFFWLVLLWPGDGLVRPLLGHFFLLALVLMAFATSPSPRAPDDETSAFLPWFLRLLFVGGSVAVVVYTLVEDPGRLKTRLTPDQAEFANWWGPFLATTFIGFAVGLFLRFVLGRQNPVFRTMRAWLSVVGLMMLALEIGLFVMFTTAENKPVEFLRYWQAIELAFVSAYFGTRA
jgi:hypothetical protein